MLSQAVLVRQAGVWKTRHRDPCPIVDGSQMVGHQIGPGGTVEADCQKLCVLDRGQKSIGRLAAEHRARGLDRPRHHHRPAHTGLSECFLDRDQSGLRVAGVLAGLDDEKIDPALEQPASLLTKGPHELREGDAASDRDRLGGRSHRPGHESRLRRRRGFPRRLDRELGSQPVERPRLGLEPVLGEHQRRAAEGVGLDNVGAGCEIGAVDV
jgi:hypothetical protein